MTGAGPIDRKAIATAAAGIPPRRAKKRGRNRKALDRDRASTQKIEDFEGMPRRPLQGLIQVPNASAEEAFRQGRDCWPGINVSLEVFQAHAEALGVGAGELSRHGSDLYLACACFMGDKMAQAHFRRRILPAVDHFIARLGIASDAVDEVRQILLVRLFTEDLKIGSYAGRGSLVQWLRTVTVRIALEMVHQAQPLVGDDRKLLEKMLAATGDMELELIRRSVHQRFQEALDQTFSQLPGRSKTLLRLHYIEGLNIDAIGHIYQVHRATVARWLLAIRSAVLAGIRERLALTLNPTSSDFRSLVAALSGDLQISVERLTDGHSVPGGGGL